MNRIFIYLYARSLDDGNVAFQYIKRIVWGEKWPQIGRLNTKNFIITCLKYRKERGEFSIAQLRTLENIANGN